jgi:hypothetical protein
MRAKPGYFGFERLRGVRGLLEMDLLRPWEKALNLAKIFTLTVTVGWARLYRAAFIRLRQMSIDMCGTV